MDPDFVPETPKMNYFVARMPELYAPEPRKPTPYAKPDLNAPNKLHE